MVLIKHVMGFLSFSAGTLRFCCLNVTPCHVLICMKEPSSPNQPTCISKGGRQSVWWVVGLL